MIYEAVSLLNCDPFKGRNCVFLPLLSPLARTETDTQEAEPGKF